MRFLSTPTLKLQEEQQLVQTSFDHHFRQRGQELDLASYHQSSSFSS